MADTPWKPGKPATLVPLGNIDLATQWVPYARRVLSQLAQQGDFRRKMIVPVPGVVIHLETRGGIPRIIIEAGGSFWWWSYFSGLEGGGRIAQVVAADVPGQIAMPPPGEPSDLRGLYKYQQIFSGDKWLGAKTPHIAKTNKLLRVALYEAHDDLNIDYFMVRLGTVQDNNQPQQPTFFHDEQINLTLPAPVVGPFRLGPAVYPFLFATEWALLYGNDIGGPTATGATLVRGRYPTPDDPTTFLAQSTGVDLSYVATLTHLPGPNPGAGTELRTSGLSRIGFGYWQGNGSFDPAFPPDPEAPLDRDFYFVALVETVDEIPGSSPTQYQQAAVVFKRSIDDPHTNTMVTSWLLAEYVQPDSEVPVMYSCYEYQGKLWVIFGRYVLRDPGGSAPEDRDWFHDQYVIDKNTGVLLHTQLDCGVRLWAETATGIYGYALPAVTFSYDSFGNATEAHIEWKLRQYAFGTDAGALSLFPVEDELGDPIDLLSITSTQILSPGQPAGGQYDSFNHFVLLQH